MASPHLSPEETARRGDEIYERQIRYLVEVGNYGKIVAIDVKTGSYALEEAAAAASRQLQALQPSAEVWLVRVGHQALHRIGASSRGALGCLADNPYQLGTLSQALPWQKAQ